MIYRRRIKSDTWHLCRNCSKWPKKSYEQRRDSMTEGVPSGELCNECLAKNRKGKCK
jgi:hypothetical protein